MLNQFKTADVDSPTYVLEELHTGQKIQHFVGLTHIRVGRTIQNTAMSIVRRTHPRTYGKNFMTATPNKIYKDSPTYVWEEHYR